MTTPLIPTKIELNELTYSPEELAMDAELEAWLLALTGIEEGQVYPEGLRFIQALMTAHRTAASAGGSTAPGWKTFTFEFTTHGGLTKHEKASYIAAKIGAGTKYNYTVTGPGVPPDGEVIVSWA